MSPEDEPTSGTAGFSQEDERVLRIRAKAVLRKRARGLRSAIPRDAIASRSQRIIEALTGLEDVARAGDIALFWPIEGKNEVDLRALDASLRTRGARVHYPSIDDDGVMTFRRVDDLAALEERGQGFLDPGPSAPASERLDVIVVPGLSFDARGYRLGYGAGYYDRTLPRYSPPAIPIGVAFAFQLVADLPATETDVPVSLIVTDERVLRVG